MSILYFVFSAIIVVLSVTMLLVKRLDCWQYVLLIIFVLGMSYLSSIVGQIMGIPTIVGLVIIIAAASKVYKLENACIACIGYLINITCNNLLCFAIVSIFRISLSEFEQRYWLPFCAGYLVLLWIVMKVLRHIIYDKLNLEGYIKNVSPPVRYGLFVNMFLYVIIFFINISLGQNSGYSVEALRLNCVLFAVCMVVSALLIVACVSNMKSIEQKKAEIRQKEITENYINTMEHVLEELRAFKHDYKNIMAEMAGYIREGEIDQLKTYYYRLTQTEEIDRYKDLYVWKSLRNIQPMEIKGVLYEKVLSIVSKNIDLEIKIESNLRVMYSDIQIINRILGVFIDNAMEAAMEAEEKVVIIEAWSIDNGVAFKIANTCKEMPDLAKIFRRGYSTKGRGRGMGLYWVQNVLKGREELIHEMDVKDGIVIQKLDVLNS